MIVYALSTGNMLGLGLIALAWIVFSLVVAIVLPRRRQDFPKNVGSFLALCAVFFAATLFAVFYFGKESHESEAAGSETPVMTQTGATETQGSETTPPPTETGTTAPSGGAADLTAGKAVFEKAACGSCHVLADAKSTGAVGPDLDSLKPDEATVAHQVENGGGAMPAFKGTLTEAEIQSVAVYVSQVAGNS